MPNRPVRSTRNTRVNYAESVSSYDAFDNDSEYVPDSEEMETRQYDYSVRSNELSISTPKFNTRMQTRSSSRSDTTSENEETSFRNIGESRVLTRSAHQSASQVVRRSARLRSQKY